MEQGDQRGQQKAYLHRPEVKGEEEEDEEEAGDEAFAEPVAEEVGHDGTHAEEEVEKGGQRVPRKEPSRILEVAKVGHPPALNIWVTQDFFAALGFPGGGQRPDGSWWALAH